MRSWGWVGVVALFAAAGPLPARAQDPPNVVEAREHLNRGTQLLEQENYDAALAEFERAYEIVGEHPARHLILYNIALAHERMFRYDLALEYYNRFLAEAPPDAPQRAEVQGTIRTLENFLATVQIQSNVAAEVWVANRQVGTAPGTIRIPAGRHTIELRAQGYTDGRREIQIAARETQTLSFTLSELASQYRGISPVFFWGATGLAIAAALAGGGVGIGAVLRRGDVDAQLGDDALRRDGDALEAARRDIETLALTADILFGTAGVFAITAVVLAFLTDWGGAPASSATESAAALELSPFAGPSGVGLGLGGTF